MAYIEMIPKENAQGDLKKLYDDYTAPWGGVDNILKIHSLLPHTLKSHYDLYKSIMFDKGPLTRRQREMIALVVSITNKCTYCIHHHGDALFRVTRDRSFTDSIKNNYHKASISVEERIMLQYAEELTLKPSQDFSHMVQKLKDNGWSDTAILQITLIVGYFNFVNRLAIGLGVELESYWNPDGYSDPAKPMSHDDQ